MTPTQYYFPYLFNTGAFNTALLGFGLISSIVYDRETSMPEQLDITSLQDRKILLSVPFGRTLMIEGDNLFYWETDTNLVDIVQIDLKNITDDPWVLNTKLDLSAFHIGKNAFTAYLDTETLVTYAKKDSIMYAQANREKYAIVIAGKDYVNIIPFDWFNTASSEYDYTWPATARLDMTAGKLYGQGIRMPDFCIDLNKDDL